MLRMTYLVAVTKYASTCSDPIHLTGLLPQQSASLQHLNSLLPQHSCFLRHLLCQWLIGLSLIWIHPISHSFYLSRIFDSSSFASHSSYLSHTT